VLSYEIISRNSILDRNLGSISLYYIVYTRTKITIVISGRIYVSLYYIVYTKTTNPETGYQMSFSR